MELLNTLGINGWLLLWQIILFLVLLFLLKTFAYGPILQALDERETRLKKGLTDAKRAEYVETFRRLLACFEAYIEFVPSARPSDD